MFRELDHDACYRALQTRDPRFDGVFYVGVLTTGIYCRPICPAGPPKIENCQFLPSAAAAHELGLRPCRRCRPELTPGVAGWRGTANTVSRALHLITEGELNEGSVDSLSERLGITARHLRRLFDRHLGASPIAVAQAHRVLFAKKLLNETSLNMTEVAMAAGFGSIRRFNTVIQKIFGASPRQLRQVVNPGSTNTGSVTLKMPFSPPYDWSSMIQFLSLRAIAGVEAVESEHYYRSFSIDGATGVVEVKPGHSDDHLLATIWTNNIASLGPIISRLRRLFDLDADMAAIDAHLAADPILAPRIRARPGVRVPGAWDSFELATRAILGQQISVQAATTFAERLTSLCGSALVPNTCSANGKLCRLFPTPEAVSRCDLTKIGLTRKRAQTLQNLGLLMTEDPYLLRPFETLEASIEKLLSVPGIGPWTAQYIAMRALREPDAFPASDLGLLRALKNSHGRPTPAQLLSRTASWRPWRAYGAIRLWLQPSLDTD